jgi:ribonuclease E
MLINAQRPEELRIAIVRGNTLENFQVDVAESGLSRGNIYRGTIANIQPSLNAAFIDYGAERHGFLAIQDVVPEAYYRTPRGATPRIDEVLDRSKPIVVQVTRDAVAQKGASLTTSLSLAGRYLVLTPFDDTRGVSRKVEDEETRRKLKALVANLELPDGCGVIVRTNALDQNKTTISRDLAALLRLWKRVQTAAVTGKGSRLLYSDQDLIVQALRDHLDSSIEEVLVDDEAAYQKAEAYIQAFLPRAKISLQRYAERLPLFSRFDLEPQIDRIYERRVELPSGGSIVIDGTEALTAIDVNSGRSTRAATQEETAVHTNLEAAAEVARQLRLRDIGGLVVVDFIDMRGSKNQRRIEKAMRDAMKADKARSTVGRISGNGLLEINRQRIQQALQMRTHRPCPTCAGTGRLASEEMVTLNLLRRVEARAASGLVAGVRIGLHPELADAMQNSRRQELAELEREFDIRIDVIAAPGLHRPEEQIEWFKRERPASRPARPKPAVVALEPWDLALAAGLEDEEAERDEEEPGEEESGPAAAAGLEDDDDLGTADEPGEDGGPEDSAGTAGGRPRRAAAGTGRQRHAGGASRTPAGRGNRAGAGDRRRAPLAGRGLATAAPGATSPVPAGTLAAAPGAGDAAAADDEAEARRGRKRRRGGRKRKAAPRPDGAGAAADGEPRPLSGGGAPAETAAAPGEAAAGAGPAKRPRRRRRRRGTGATAGTGGAPGGAGEGVQSGDAGAAGPADPPGSGAAAPARSAPAPASAAVAGGEAGPERGGGGGDAW